VKNGVFFFAKLSFVLEIFKIKGNK